MLKVSKILCSAYITNCEQCGTDLMSRQETNEGLCSDCANRGWEKVPTKEFRPQVPGYPAQRITKIDPRYMN